MGLESYDANPWYNVTARISMTSTKSTQTARYIEDTFQISIVEMCRLVEF